MVIRCIFAGWMTFVLSEGWGKMQQIVPTSQGNINIHYVYNQTLKIYDDFKFKP